jgi:hypothetical protein
VRSGSAIEALRAHLNNNGDLGDEGLRLLQAAWPEFSGSGVSGMEAHKLPRVEQVAWHESHLEFVIERHGGTVLGSSRAELQRWSLDFDKRIAEMAEQRYRQLRPRRAALDVDDLADELVDKMERSLDDSRLEWSPDRQTARIIVQAAINPEGEMLAKQTAEGRRGRLREALLARLPRRGWREVRPGRWSRKS